MAEDFEAAVEDGLRLAKRIYFGKDRAVAPPKPSAMERAAGQSYLPTSPMLYAVITDPAIVDNPDIPSYQPHVHGRCDPPALIPLQMNGVSLDADCYLDTAFLTFTATWRVHCVMGSRAADCRIAVPMGEQGSILGVEVEVPQKLYTTQLIGMENDGFEGNEKLAKLEDGGFLKPHIFTLTIPQIDGGTNISVKIRWSQKLLYHDGEFTLDVPFNFPNFVIPAGKKISKREKIQLNVNSGPGTEILCKTTSHPLKEGLRQAGKLGFLYDSEVLAWSRNDFTFIYSINSSHTVGGVFLDSQSPLDVDRREMFCCYIFPGKQQTGKVFRKEVVFAVDMSGSMKGKLLDDIKNSIIAALGKLNPEDKFNIIAFNGETYPFSSSLEPAMPKVIENVTQWINANFVPSGGTNILIPLNQAVEMLSHSKNSIPIIFLITDGAVEDERNICDVMKKKLANQKVFPRIYTLGIGTFCNQYFLKMLAMIGHGYHAAASDVGTIGVQMAGLFSKASSIFLADVALQNLEDIDDLEMLPHHIPDLSSKSPLILSGRYRGIFPETIIAKGILPNMSSFSIELKIKHAKEIPISQILAKQQIELLTAQAWYSQSKELEEKIAKLSVRNAIVSEYTNMVVLETQRGKTTDSSITANKTSKKADHQKIENSKLLQNTRFDHQKIENSKLLQNTRFGFGNISATNENVIPGSVEAKLPEAAEIFVRAASNCCGMLFGRCCCMCCIQTCSRMNDQCAIVLTQLCGAMACLGCYSCCSLCCGGN